jgi:nucleotide-binding universal stress UspA family protein
LKHAVRFAEEFGAELTLLYVSEPPPAATFAAAEKELRAFAPGVGNESVADIQWKIRAGVPSHEIVEAAKESDADLIVIATHGSTGWKHFCIGSTAERVVRAAPCPVLVVREKEHELSGSHL